MTEEIRFAAMLMDTWSDLQSPSLLWQLGALAGCLALAWLIERAMLERVARRGDAATAAQRFGRSGLRRVLFPLLALIFVFAARAVLAKYQTVHLLNLAVPLLTSFAAIRFVVFTVRQGIGRSSWLGNFERIFASLAWAVVALHILGWLPEVIDALESVSFKIGSQRLSLWTLIQGLGLVMFTLLIALWAAGALERRLSVAAGLDDSMRLVLMRVAKALLIVVAVLVALPMVGIDLTTLSVFGGALGVGLGFGLQKIAANYVSGFIILLDRSLRIGNLISVGTERGIVTQINTRYTVLRAGSGIESLVPNETLIGSVVQNETYSDTRIVVPINIQVSYATDLERAMQILVEAATTHERVIAEPAPKAFVVAFGESGIDLRLTVWIADPQEGTLGVISHINLQVWKRFRAEGIEIPYPQREVRVVHSEAGLAQAVVDAAAAD
ncbi:mechanosensitive ion channel family protein [Aromatoleum petrolei]|uniref:Mechanosensitive ion channel n=1 Tax=Aromatoleum petrolei TaxID=76116 RepID=A0ABX1MU97_9RHOO|nr:mechanosensitive ion channel domain-containing protein [Aromatoleum petrolei]NMF90816.1 mechanosensitive ion channel [Aromatoleum petrolei]QTQ35615.1 putative mechanosensitive ion channel [Aromatoleum petrolei]